MERLVETPRAISAMQARLMEWYLRSRRALPWRQSSDPYAIWVSEIMLQQTRVAAVIERYQSFLARFPTLVSLALASEEDVLAQWSGLGYYRRARMLHKAAKFVAANLAGNLPKRADELRSLPGIGVYTAAAIASIANGEQVAVVDGNVERVICRLAGWNAARPRGGAAALRSRIQSFATQLLNRDQPGDSNQAIMELGALICTPRSPQCPICPLSPDCKTRGEHKAARRAPMSSRIVAHALSVRSSRSPSKSRAASTREVLLEQRPPHHSVMPGMWELPMLHDAAVSPRNLRMTIRHAIMQVNYYVRIRTVFEDDVDALTVVGGERRWVPLQEAGGMALTGLTRKVLMRAHLFQSAALDSITRDAHTHKP